MITKDFFLKVGFKNKKIKTILKNEVLANKLWDIFSKRESEEPNPAHSDLVYYIATCESESVKSNEETLLNYIFEDKLNSKQQLKLAENYVNEKKTIENVEEFETTCGVGVTITEDDIKGYLREFIQANEAEIKELEGKINHPKIFPKIKDGMPLANPGQLISLSRPILNELLGDILQKKNKKKVKKPKAKKVEAEKYSKIDITKLVAREIEDMGNSKEIMAKHLKATGGKVMTRFPPEPNGILHIGHARAIRFNFSIAGTHKGDCILRFDDTNPEKETLEFIYNIQDNVKWMGYAPSKVTFSSDYFQRIHDLTIKLIKMGYAYVCKLPKEKQKIFREEMIPSPFRDQTVEETLKEFELMKAGYYDEGEACLRARIDYKSVDNLMRDPVLYRIMYTPHPKTKSRWCIYPMYDYTHPLCDSFENITHSCCTLEFEIRRDLYYWPLITLDLYRPYVWEFSRLNVTHTMLSKRKILQLVNKGIVDGWDDPRLFTLAGIERRGIPVPALNDFLDHVPVTRRGNNNFIQIELFNNTLMKYLNVQWSRTLGVVDPVKLVIDNLDDDYKEELEINKFPIDESKGSYKTLFTKNIYVDRDDVRLKKEKKFYRIHPGSVVRLKYAKPIFITSVIENNGSLEVHATTELPENTDESKIKATLNWIAKEDAKEVETRIYDLLFTEPIIKDLNEIEKLVNPDSKKIFKSYVNSTVYNNLKTENQFQFERQGYFALDPDTDLNKDKVVFNLVLSQNAKKN